MSIDNTIIRKGYLQEKYHYFHLKDTASQEHSFHFHEFDKVVILLSGHVNYIIENNTYPLKPDSILLVPHHAIHKALIDLSEPYERIILYIESEYLYRVLPNAELRYCFTIADQSKHYMLSPDAQQWGDIAHVLRSFELSLNDSQHGAEAMRDTLIMQFFIHINRISTSETPTPTLRIDPKIRETLTYISENLSSNLSADSLASRVYLSSSHFMRLFKSQTGETVHAYIRQKRLLYAASLIREGLPAGQAASASGFNDYSVFNRAFRTLFGFSPTELHK